MTAPNRTLVEVIARTLRDEVYEFSKSGARRVAHAIADSIAASGLLAATEREAKLREALEGLILVWQITEHSDDAMLAAVWRARAALAAGAPTGREE